MPSFEQFCENLADRLRVDDSYVTNDIPQSVKRYVKRLLRDYHFPKSIRKNLYPDVDAGNQSYALPDDFKKDLLVIFMDNSDVANVQFSDPLTRREGFVVAQPDGIPRHYWQEGSTLWTDITIPADTGTGTNLVVVYESNDFDYNSAWLLNDYEDVLFSLAMFRLAGELGKPELAQTWALLWLEDQKSLAIFLNELEFNHMEILMRPATPVNSSVRYPGGS